MSTSIAPEAASDVLTTKQAAEYLGLSPNTLSGWRYLNVGPKYQRLGTSRRAAIRYRRDWLDEWLDASTVVPDGTVHA